MTKNTSQGKELNGGRNTKGQFVKGYRGGPGRQVGSRNKLTTEFLDDVYAKWQKCGKEVLDFVARDDPIAFLKIVAGLMPAKLDQTMLSVNVELAEARTFDEMYQTALKALEYIGAEIEVEAEPELIESDATAE
jgi:hypothetical protein